ncbi:MAG: hypothetical protein WCP86_06695, partial [bacterium]
MKVLLGKLLIVCGVAIATAVNVSAAVEAKFPPIQPTPQSIKVGQGSMELTAQSRIVVTDPRLDVHAAVLVEEIQCLTDWKLAVVKG